MNNTLSDRVNIPRLCLGTWIIGKIGAAQDLYDAVEIGYCHIDTGQAYRNENGTREGKVRGGDLISTPY